MAYFGDHFLNDVHAAGSFRPNDGGQKWDSIAVVEELYRFDERSGYGRDPQLIDNSTHWSPNYFFDQAVVNGQ